ncbi:hypothetical protein EXIGLDRAFT_756658 [Exidia glandulosa HHB12029]|uniref:Nudix hydrolase domain-containing protein n=1 Tax=Exidia glandulosa HHB12029 TaxID=1314781 RepID=A0A165B5P4_EXIGL|nr:hypothetical protein EXIGLDRAFT_756658 [Exidia glandulosa HHB12029]
MNLGAERYHYKTTQNSTRLLANVFWASADFRVQTGVVLIHPKQERVFMVYNKRLDMTTLPRGKSGDIDALLGSPAESVQAMCGHQCTLLPLPKLVKEYTEPEHEAIARIEDERSVDPFYITFDTLWVDTPTERWSQGYQLITFWYAAYVDGDISPNSTTRLDPSARWVPLQDVSAALKGDDFGSKIFGVFTQLWDYLKTPAEQRQTVLK